ncbi:MAG TPA: sulfotransferase [Candidatus Sulfotelmatobacter sp.]|nr:sulfotransferase [Candidatus Sulfotelmatobacter sp.]
MRGYSQLHVPLRGIRLDLPHPHLRSVLAPSRPAARLRLGKALSAASAGGPPGPRWVLKSPDHVHGLTELFAVCPDARVIQTHRNPLEVLHSSAELTRVLHGLYAWPGDPAQLRAREGRILAEGTERFIQFRDLHPELAERFIDVKYSELAADPIAVVGRIYHRLGLPLAEEAARHMRALAASRTRYRRPRVHSKTGWLRAELAAEASRFERYCSRYDLPCLPAELGR